MTTRTGFSKKIDVAANLMTIALVLLVAALLLKGGFPSARTGALIRRSPIQVGSHIPNSLNVNWSAHQRTLVLGLQTTCHFCAESGPFFRTLTNGAPKDVRIVAALPQTPEVARKYLDGLGVHVDEIKQVPLAAIGIKGTPTLLLVNSLGVVKDMWTGKLQPQGEASVLSALQATSSVGDPPNTRRVRLNRKSPDEPARIMVVKEADVDVTPGVRPYKSWEGKPFQAGDDWVRNLAITIRNLSNKEIVAASLNVYFPETGTGRGDSPVFGDVISLGRRPAMYAKVGGTNTETLEPAGTSPPLHILPGQELTVPLAQYYPEIKQAVEQARPISNLSICNIVLQGVFFSDGTMWAHGHEFKKPDPNAPGRYIEMTADEFWARVPGGSN